MSISARESLNKLREEVIQCKKCQDLVKTRRSPVAGIGAPNARVIILGYYPSEGAEAGVTPYTGDDTGNLIRKCLDKVDLSLEKDIYLTYMVKCIPRNVDLTITIPRAEHINNCLPFLSREISITTPHLIISLGFDTSIYLLDNFFSLQRKYKNMNELHMKIFENPSFKVVSFRDPKEVIAGAFPEEKYVEDFQSLSKLFEVV